jgi:chemotaxis protein CheZ
LVNGIVESASADRDVRLPGLEPPDAAEVYRQLGQITRQLHDALEQLGVMPRLQQSAQDLPDVRSRLQYVMRKSGEAAARALSAVERAKAERERIGQAARRLAEAIDLDATAAGRGAAAALAELRAAGARIDDELTEILLAQDFHDLTGQVVAQVAALAIELEDNLVDLLLRAAPDEPIPPSRRRFGGPAVDAGARAEVARDQQEVDALLAGLGF